ncbi:orotidine 5'-phosphate decarboxylase [Candidatus Daviesbacteria bacterium RIFCSPHIGHO2_02_FULL_36_13]|uniref:Orotidine-5'-phosphate decarboxylase n=1 Tax=Candidatus Daviesbacteria bacterium RIFCSPHIGHO2_02_FULL_36_13 TaxID=1797768 RepID=A0A1F5JWH8_9BACT|nr:MAG: orotidine 5'-phosphate decarboxylase [Candidatus Daviesbacteria bacterium RIFCSPHIGHO2_02_FULL_36_13]OGE43665.1 MAG: orotidine 5'-phosphate decarboxylase [Candidatus Daviesbacteria bacterium RIFCSPLOWO2_01_FULL_36_8]
MPTFKDKLKLKWDENKFVCVGLDSSDFSLLQKVVDQTYDYVSSYKINSAFFEEEGVKGLENLKKIIQYIKENYPDIPVILDAKRGDIGNTNEAYASAIFDDLGADGVTVHPYLGKESLTPFLKRADKGIFILARTSNPGAGEFQDLEVEGKPLYQVVAQHVKDWDENGNLGVVVGATYPEELKAVREIVGDMPILVPGIGAQGGDLEAVLKNGLDSNQQGLLIASSRGIIFAEDPKKAAEDLHNQIKEILKNV